MKKQLKKISLIGCSKIELSQKQQGMIVGGGGTDTDDSDGGSGGCACCICRPDLKGAGSQTAKSSGGGRG